MIKVSAYGDPPNFEAVFVRLSLDLIDSVAENMVLGDIKT